MFRRSRRDLGVAGERRSHVLQVRPNADESRMHGLLRTYAHRLWRQAQGTANLTQGQRDFFGAHGFEIEGRGSDLHGTWPSTLGK